MLEQKAKDGMDAPTQQVSLIIKLQVQELTATRSWT